MRIEDKKYVWWGLLGIGVAAFFYFLSSRNKNTSTNVQVPYLVPTTTTGASPTADQSLSQQPNIIGSSNNSTVPNFSNPYGPATSVMEAPNTYGFMPILSQQPTQGPVGSVSFGMFEQTPGAINFQNGMNQPGANYTIPTFGNPQIR
jgi:hypothetical protein